MSKASWFKSSYSQGENTACVEVAFAWRKSSYSGNENTACVEVAFVPTAVAVRDSKDPSGPHFAVDASAWRGFLGTVATAVTRTE
ncbi:DUF397 domain-containing protein [Amycolatopsis sp. NPDC051106]|uniref:DUF397 domain-containing protein n=1 Tax=unclassified Amycolatopsis TaxID=2618356 RepID=UPI00343AFBF6